MKAKELAVSRRDSWRNIASLTMSAASSTFWADESVHSEERAISLELMHCHANPGPLVILCQVRNSVRPMHLFDHNCDHDYYFELPRKGERDTQSISRCSTAHHRDVRVVPRAN
jgi:hypothetical protein